VFSAEKLLVMGVTPSKRRTGGGSKLLEAVMDRVKKSGWDCLELELEVSVANAGALAFDRHHRFKSRGTVQHWKLGRLRLLRRAVS
jgi:GNAT superfamily N-acetyltransferase